jgi:hypothetical protein
MGPRTASAFIAADCDTRLAICADNATSNYDDCVCNVAPYADGCKAYFAAPAGLPTNSPTTVEGCVVQLQGDLVKCQALHLACEILPKAPNNTR